MCCYTCSIYWLHPVTDYTPTNIAVIHDNEFYFHDFVITYTYVSIDILQSTFFIPKNEREKIYTDIYPRLEVSAPEIQHLNEQEKTPKPHNSMLVNHIKSFHPSGAHLN